MIGSPDECFTHRIVRLKCVGNVVKNNSEFNYASKMSSYKHATQTQKIRYIWTLEGGSNKNIEMFKNKKQND